MTFTLSTMSGKAIRLVSRYLAMIQMGGKLGDAPDAFYDGCIARTGRSAVEIEREFGMLTDAYENRVRDEEGFLGDHYDVVEFVRGKLTDGFLREEEATSDHRRKGVATTAVPSTAPTKRRAPPGDNDHDRVKGLIKKLASCEDRREKQRIRRALRKLGHRGGGR